MRRCLLAFLDKIPPDQRKKLDLTFRLSFLEGVMRRPVGDWAREPRKGAVEARQFFEDQKIPIDQGWFVASPTAPWVRELDIRAATVAKGYERNLKRIGMSVGDLVQDLIMGIGSPQAKRQNNVFYSFGLSWSNPEELTLLDPEDAKGVIGPGLKQALVWYIEDALKRGNNRVMMERAPNEESAPGQNTWMDQVSDPSNSRNPKELLIDLLVDESGLRNAVLQLAEAAILKLTPPQKNPRREQANEMIRFVLNRYFKYLSDPAFNKRDPDVKSKRPNRSPMWSLRKRINAQVQADMLEKFSTKADGTPMLKEELDALKRKLYSILGSTERGSGGDVGLPPIVDEVLEKIRENPTVEALLERFEEEENRLNFHNMTASVVRAFLVKKAWEGLGLLGTLLRA